MRCRSHWVRLVNTALIALGALVCTADLFNTLRFEWVTILTILPAALVVIVEHVSHLVVMANIVKKDLVRWFAPFHVRQ